MKMQIAQGTVCAQCGKAPAYVRWSVNRALKMLRRHILCGEHGKGLMKIRPRVGGGTSA